MAITYGPCLGPVENQYTAREFSRALQNAAGDGVCQWGSRFAAELSGLSLSLGSGFALAGGHWLENDSPLALSISPAYNHRDRLDMAAVQVDHAAREVRLCLLEDADPAALPPDPLTVPLYGVRVQRGAANLLPGDLTDLRRMVPQLSALTKEGLRAYAFVQGGIDQEVARILGLYGQTIAKAEKAVQDLSHAIANAGGTGQVGDLAISRRQPQPASQWVPCNGQAIPPEYALLRQLVGPTAPRLRYPDPRLGAYLFGGEPSIHNKN